MVQFLPFFYGWRFLHFVNLYYFDECRWYRLIITNDWASIYSMYLQIVFTRFKCISCFKKSLPSQINCIKPLDKASGGGGVLPIFLLSDCVPFSPSIFKHWMMTLLTTFCMTSKWVNFHFHGQCRGYFITERILLIMLYLRNYSNLPSFLSLFYVW